MGNELYSFTIMTFVDKIYDVPYPEFLSKA